MVDSSSIVQRVQQGDWQALISCPQPLLWAESRLVPAGPGSQGGFGCAPQGPGTPPDPGLSGCWGAGETQEQLQTFAGHKQ